jgi:hypothetical protein
VRGILELTSARIGKAELVITVPKTDEQGSNIEWKTVPHGVNLHSELENNCAHGLETFSVRKACRAFRFSALSILLS